MELVCPGSLASFLLSPLPGLPHFLASERPRALIFFGSFISGLSLAFLGWGTMLGWVGIGFSIAVQVGSLADLVARRSYPHVANGRALGTALFLLSVFLYAPGLFAFSTWLTPTWSDAGTAAVRHDRDGYLLNGHAYRENHPRGGHWVWLQEQGRRPAGLGYVLAISGQEVDWSNGHLIVDGDQNSPLGNLQPNFTLESIHFRIPKSHILVATHLSPGPVPQASDWMIVPNDAVIGRVWAQISPIWERRLLL